MEELDPYTRIALANTVQNIVDNADYFYTPKTIEGGTEKLIAYLKRHKIPIPNIPDDARGADVSKMMIRVWANIEALKTMATLLGEDR